MSDKTRFLNVAQGSLEECRYYLILIENLGYGATADMEVLLEEVSKLLVSYASAIESNRRAPHKFCNSCTPTSSYLTNPQWLENGQYTNIPRPTTLRQGTNPQ